MPTTFGTGIALIVCTVAVGAVRACTSAGTGALPLPIKVNAKPAAINGNGSAHTQRR
jgi:hypothetical protein